MRKLFTFLKKGSIHLESPAKIIPKEDLETLLEANELLEMTKKNMQEHKEQTLDECEKLKEQAYEEGLQKGLTELNEKIIEIDHFFKQKNEEIQKKLIPLAIQAARKILGEELKITPQRIGEIVAQALKPVMQHKHVKIYVSKADKEILENEKEKIRSLLEQVETFSLQTRTDIEPGGCIIETEAGIINAQLENQWRALEQAFSAFLKKQ